MMKSIVICLSQCLISLFLFAYLESYNTDYSYSYLLGFFLFVYSLIYSNTNNDYYLIYYSAVLACIQSILHYRNDKFHCYIIYTIHTLFIFLGNFSIYNTNIYKSKNNNMNVIDFKPYEKEIRQYLFKTSSSSLHNIDSILTLYEGREEILYDEVLAGTCPFITTTALQEPKKDTRTRTKNNNNIQSTIYNSIMNSPHNSDPSSHNVYDYNNNTLTSPPCSFYSVPTKPYTHTNTNSTTSNTILTSSSYHPPPYEQEIRALLIQHDPDALIHLPHWLHVYKNNEYTLYLKIIDIYYEKQTKLQELSLHPSVTTSLTNILPYNYSGLNLLPTDSLPFTSHTPRQSSNLQHHSSSTLTGVGKLVHYVPSELSSSSSVCSDPDRSITDAASDLGSLSRGISRGGRGDSRGESRIRGPPMESLIERRVSSPVFGMSPQPFDYNAARSVDAAGYDTYSNRRTAAAASAGNRTNDLLFSPSSSSSAFAAPERTRLQSTTNTSYHSTSRPTSPRAPSSSPPLSPPPLSPYEVRIEVHRTLAQYNPSLLPQVDSLLYEYTGREGDLLARLRRDCGLSTR